MKAADVEVLISTAFSGITSDINAKAWTNALRAYRLIIAVLVRSLYSNGANTYHELSDYLDTAREHPTGRLWVDCLIKPTLMAFMFLSGESITMTSFSSSTVLTRCCHISLLQVTIIMPATWAGMCIGWNTFLSMPKRFYCQAHTCRYSDGGTPVPADQFGEQTYIELEKCAGGMKGISTSTAQVALCGSTVSLIVCVHLDIAMEHMCDEAGDEKYVEGDGKNKRKKEGENKEIGWGIGAEIEKYFTPSTGNILAYTMSATAMWHHKQWTFRTPWPSGANRASSSALR